MSAIDREPRDLLYERTFLDEADDRAARRFGTHGNAFARCVERRLALGEQLYGSRFLQYDASKEILQEAWDAAAYAVLEAQRRLLLHEEDEEAAWHLHEIAQHAAAIDFHARRLRG